MYCVLWYISYGIVTYHLALFYAFYKPDSRCRQIKLWFQTINRYHCRQMSVKYSCTLYWPHVKRLHTWIFYCMLQGDMGGERVLQKKWTTFLKAQLLCSLPDDGFPFNIIQDMFVLTPSPADWKNTVFYGVFTSQWWVPVLIKTTLIYQTICIDLTHTSNKQFLYWSYAIKIFWKKLNQVHIFCDFCFSGRKVEQRATNMNMEAWTF